MRRIHFSKDLGVNTVVFIDWQRKQGRAWEGSGEGKVPRVPLRSKQWSAPVQGNFSLRPCEQSCTLEWFPNTPSKNALGASTGTQSWPWLTRWFVSCSQEDSTSLPLSLSLLLKWNFNFSSRNPAFQAGKLWTKLAANSKSHPYINFQVFFFFFLNAGKSDFQSNSASMCLHFLTFRATHSLTVPGTFSYTLSNHQASLVAQHIKNHWDGEYM